MHFLILQVMLVMLTLVSATPIYDLPRDDKTSSTQSAANPIAQQYPNVVTGTINGTVAVVPIPYPLARSIIPSKYGILKTAYESLLPGFPRNSYPVSLPGSFVPLEGI
jgi:hypothetical protein